MLQATSLQTKIIRGIIMEGALTYPASNKPFAEVDWDMVCI